MGRCPWVSENATQTCNLFLTQFNMHFVNRIIKSEITKIHLNLSIAVGIAQVLFLAAGSEKLVGKTVYISGKESPYYKIKY